MPPLRPKRWGGVPPPGVGSRSWSGFLDAEILVDGKHTFMAEKEPMGRPQLMQGANKRTLC